MSRISYQPKNMIATPLQALDFNPNRAYLAVVASGVVTVTISGGEPFDIQDGEVWAPIPAPMNDITFSGTGTLIVG